MNQNNIFRNNNYSQEINYNNEDNEGILTKTGNAVSSFFSKIIYSVNPFKRQSYTQNPYDLNSINDPSNFLNNESSQNINNNLYLSQPNSPNYNNYEQVSLNNEYSSFNKNYEE